MPPAPEPANRSRTAAPSSSGSRIPNSVCLTRSVSGLVPGPGAPPERARAVFHLKLADLHALLSKKASGMALFIKRKLKVQGDLAFAMRANSLLG